MYFVVIQLLAAIPTKPLIWHYWYIDGLIRLGLHIDLWNFLLLNNWTQLNLLIYGSCEAGLNKHREHNNKTQSIEAQEHKTQPKINVLIDNNASAAGGFYPHISYGPLLMDPTGSFYPQHLYLYGNPN